MEKIDRALRVSGGLEDRSLVAVKYLEPRSDVGRMIVADFVRDPEICTQKCRAEFGDELFTRIAFVTPYLLTEVPGQAIDRLRPVDGLMAENAHEALRVWEILHLRHLDEVAGLLVKGTIPAVANAGTRSREKFLGRLDSFKGRSWRSWRNIEVLRQTSNLTRIENGVAPEERNRAFDFVAVFVFFDTHERVGVDDKRAFLPLLNAGVEFEGLLESHPKRRREPALGGFSPENQDVDPGIGQPIVAQRTRDAAPGIPGLRPRAHAFFQ